MEGERGMARETKVGLIAGLAFIICFAVILANRGQKPKLTTHRPYLVDRGVDPLPNLDASRNERRRTQPKPKAAQERPAASGRQPAAGDQSPAVMPSSGARVVFDQPNSSHQQRVADPTPPSERANSPQSSQETVAGGGDPAGANVDVDTSRVLTSRDDVEERRRLLQQQLDALSVRTAAARQTNRPAPLRVSNENALKSPAHSDGRATPTRVDRPRGKHTVVAGDNLSKIAKQYYGTKSKRVVEAIFQANRAALSSPDVVRVGMELVLPSIDGADVTPVRTAAPDARERSSETQPGSTPSQATFRWYQIKKNDRYASIARRELGDEGRWREIFELNKDKFPDPQLIREGVRIKLPTATVANAAGGRR